MDVINMAAIISIISCHMLPKSTLPDLLLAFPSASLRACFAPAILASRDVRDNKFLELAVAAKPHASSRAIPICLTCTRSTASPSSHQHNSSGRQSPHEVVALPGHALFVARSCVGTMRAANDPCAAFHLTFF
jgi:hypothetical protein